MSAPGLRIVRRPRGASKTQPGLTLVRETIGSHDDSLTAASQPVVDASMFKSFSGLAGRNSWQAEAWDMLDIVGELRYYTSWRANSCSRVRLVASEFDPRSGLPTGTITDESGAEGQLVKALVNAIAGGTLGQASLIRRATECLTIPGEHWIAILALDGNSTDDAGQPLMSWFVVTREEIKNNSDGTVSIELPDATMHDYNKSIDSLFRVWNPRPRRAKEADSPVRACLDSLREIVRTTKKIKNASKSRLIGNGVLFVPQEMSLPSAYGPVAAGAPQGTVGPALTGVPASDRLSNLLYSTANAAIKDEDSQAAFIPLIATVPGDYLEKVQHLNFGADVMDVEIKVRNDAIARLALGLDVSPERLLGVGNTSNHWSAWQVGDEDVQLHIKPVMETLCCAINDQVLKVVLTRLGIDPGKYCLWYDAGHLTQDPDKTDEATEARDRGALNNVAYRRYLGMTDDDGYDLTSIEGWQEWASDAVAMDPALLPALQPLLPDFMKAIDFPAAVPSTPPAPDAEDKEEEIDNQGNPPKEKNAITAAGLAERMLVTRALELAGKRRVKVNDREQAARLRDIPAHQYHRYMPAVTADEIPKLISGWESALEDDVIARLGIDSEALKLAVRTRVRDELLSAGR